MNIKERAKELAATAGEEWNEHSKDPKDQKQAEEYRAQRNAARVAQGKPPLGDKPGTGTH